MDDLTNAEADLLLWLSHGPGEHQEGFIAQDHAGEKSMMYRAVSLTADGREALAKIMQNPDRT